MVEIILLLCAISAADRAWIDSAVEAWRITSREALHLGDAPLPQMVFFDEQCTSDGRPHKGTIRVPDGQTIPAQVTSFAGSHDGKPYLVMALPSVWRSVPRHADNPALDRLTRSVFVHEMTHTVQAAALGNRIDALIEKYQLPGSDIDDDIVQKKFGSDPELVAAWEKERDLLYAAARAGNDADRRELLAQALAAMRERRSRFVSGDRSVYAHLEDIFLIMEGAAGWAAVQDVKRDLPEAEAIDFIRGSRRWWTQDEGIGLFLAIDKALPGWQEMVFGDDPPTAEELIATAAAAPQTEN